MKCPGCASDMAQVELQSIEIHDRSESGGRGPAGSAGGEGAGPLSIDRCPACGGIVLDKGESEIIDSLGLAQVIEGGVSAAHAHDRATAARCHECARDMIALRGAGD